MRQIRSRNEFITNNNNNSFLMQQNPFCATIGISWKQSTSMQKHFHIEHNEIAWTSQTHTHTHGISYTIIVSEILAYYSYVGIAAKP